MKINFLVLFCCFTLICSSQIRPKSTIKSAKSPNAAASQKNLESKDSPYIMTEIRLSSLFLDNKIPSDFPKNDSTISREENKRIAIQWAKAHKNLFKEKYRTDIDSMNF
jgi:hypothetical protein